MLRYINLDCDRLDAYLARMEYRKSVQDFSAGTASKVLTWRNEKQT